jgi:hypothetical protein
MLEYIFGTVYRIIVTIINCVTGIFRLEFGIIKKTCESILGPYAELLTLPGSLLPAWFFLYFRYIPAWSSKCQSNSSSPVHQSDPIFFFVSLN